jgi:KDO2-lipid IV(A) lauroyltransferase
VIVSNLRRAFPEKSEKEIARLTYKNYQNLTDILLESLKGFSLRNKTLIKRYQITNPQIIEQYYQANQSVIGVTGHYGNWEWGALAGSLQINHCAIAFYKPIKNKYIDQYIKKSRANNGTYLKSIFYTSQTFKNFEDKICIYLMVADQSPSNTAKSYWVDFLGQETACLHGPEKHARNNNYPVIYLDIQRKKRGYYEVTFSNLTDNPRELKDGEITQMFMKKLEEIIRKKPENWLWSHKRWKKSRKKSQSRSGGYLYSGCD